MVIFSKYNTGGIEAFLSKENLRKILKVSHFYFKFSWNRNHNKIQHSHGFSGSYRISLEFSWSGSIKSNESLRKCLISLLFPFGGNPK